MTRCTAMAINGRCVVDQIPQVGVCELFRRRGQFPIQSSEQHKIHPLDHIGGDISGKQQDVPELCLRDQLSCSFGARRRAGLLLIRFKFVQKSEKETSQFTGVYLDSQAPQASCVLLNHELWTRCQSTFTGISNGSTYLSCEIRILYRSGLASSEFCKINVDDETYPDWEKTKKLISLGLIQKGSSS